MADALGAVEHTLDEIQALPGVHACHQNYVHGVVVVVVELARFDSATWDRVIEMVDDLGREWAGELSVDLDMTLAAA